MEKEFKTYREQIRLLKNKGLIISDEEHAINILKSTSYFALINGYKRPFKDTNGNYLPEAHFEDIENLYYFDEQMRVFLLEQLLALETRIKSSISYNFSQKHRELNAYLNTNNYNYVGEKTQPINKLVSILQGIYDGKDHKYITHYKRKHHGEVPLWVLINAMTFGQVSKMYSLLKVGEQQRICGDLGILSQKDMMSILDILTLYRNVCAHNERLYDFNTKHQLGKQYIEKFVADEADPAPDYNNIGKHLFGALAVCAYIADDGKILDDFKMLVKNAEIMQNQRLRDDLIAKMGVPANWLTDISN